MKTDAHRFNTLRTQRQLSRAALGEILGLSKASASRISLGQRPLPGHCRSLFDELEMHQARAAAGKQTWWLPHLTGCLSEHYGRITPEALADLIRARFGITVTVNAIKLKASRMGLRHSDGLICLTDAAKLFQVSRATIQATAAKLEIPLLPGAHSLSIPDDQFDRLAEAFTPLGNDWVLERQSERKLGYANGAMRHMIATHNVPTRIYLGNRYVPRWLIEALQAEFEAGAVRVDWKKLMEQQAA